LGQDMFLIGSPGPERRRLAFRFAEILNREVEYLPITRDTSESDLKQRRELRGGGVAFVDQAPVRAALHGRLLIIDGIERAERNVLHTLNNLLENREMNLEDGRTMVSHRHWQSLTARYSAADLTAKNIVPVSPNFLVIALGVAVPKYRGFPLDPPLFQCRKVDDPSPECEFELLSALFPNIPHSRRVGLVKISATLRALSENGVVSNALCFSSSSLLRVASLINIFPHMSSRDALTRMLPVFAVDGTLQPANSGAWSTPATSANSWSNVIRDVSLDYDNQIQKLFSPTDYVSDSPGSATIFQAGFEPVSLSLPTPPVPGKSSAAIAQQSLSSAQRMLIAYLLQDVAAGAHVAIIGPPGCGKSSLLKHACSLLGMPQPHIMHLYRDMTSRDLLLRRVSLEDGSTGWEPSLLVQAALAGQYVILDGLHRLQSDTLSSLSSLLLDGFCSLSDGRILTRHDRWMKLRQNCVDDDELLARGVFPILPSFRVFGTSSGIPVSSGGGSLQTPWMTAETS
jgi:MoxR-like ATPase